MSVVLYIFSMTTSQRRTPPPPEHLGELLTTRQVMARLGVQYVTLSDWRYRHRGPAWVQVGRLIRYPSALLEKYIAERLHQPEHESA